MVKTFLCSPIKKQGFALVKTVIAITLLAFALTVSVRLLGFSAKSIQQNGHRTKAVFYAQQCMEWTRNVRDSAWKQNLPWDCGFIPPSSVGTLWDISINRSVSEITGSCKQSLGYEIEASTSAKSQIDDTIFSRTVSFERIGEDKLKVHCELAWPEGSLGLDQILTNWKQ